VAGTSIVPVIIDNTVYAAEGHAILITITTGSALVYGNTCVDSTGEVNGIHFVTGLTGMQVVLNNQLTDNGAYGILSEDAASAIYAANNRTSRNTSGAVSGATDWLSATSYSHVTTAQAGADNAAKRAAEYVAPDSQNYNLKSASYAIRAGMPLYRDIGALQQNPDFPAVGNVQNDDTVDGATGTLTLPPVEDVETGVTYGAGGTEFTGTLAGGGGLVTHSGMTGGMNG
jgi:hypothetical protein